MEELLKEVQEIYPDAKIIDDCWMNIGGRDEKPKIWLNYPARQRFFLFMWEEVLCTSKDKQKIINVLKAIKDCEE